MNKYSGVLVSWALLLLGNHPLQGQEVKPSCSECTVWNAAQVPFKIYGNTYYVGPHGLSSILIITAAGDVLIDGALPESASRIAANIRTLGLQMKDVKFILNTHVHYDHAGGIAELQRESGATVVASLWSAAVLKSGLPAKDDPQYGILPNIQPVSHVRVLRDGEDLRLGDLVLTPHATPGHTPGGTSWTWRSCEAGHCMDMVYADSVSPVSADGFKFTKSVTYPNALQDFEKSFHFLSTTLCDILLTAHPDASDFWERVEKHQSGFKPDPLSAPSQCRDLADGARTALQERIKTETGR